MKVVLASAGRAFLHAFGASILVLAPGILAAPNLSKSYLVGVAALFASVAAGIKAVTEYVPQLSVGSYIGQPYGAWADAFLRAFAGALAITLPGVMNAPNLNTARALGVACVVGAFTAGFRALEGLTTKGEAPFGDSGIDPPA